MSDAWEMVVGLEVHCELQTATKLFCGCRNAFGDEPNTNVCPVCLGLPGSLPVLNERAVELAMRIGTALHCEIRPSSFHRKNYFYPDMPKDYQISQYDEPINVGGWLDLPDGTRVGITRAHMEEDTGKTTHVGGGGRIHSSDHSLVDYNRSGVPLVEIVSEPDMRSADQARAYATELRAVLVATGASDGRMEEGSMRVDANVSVRPAGSEAFGTRCEIKNLNSLRSLARAVEFEAARQIALIEAGGTVVQETRHWDEQAGRTVTLRSKEEAYDYRYFPEPDLVPVVPDAEWQARVAGAIGLLPADRRSRLVALLGDSPTPAQADQVLAVVDQGLDDLVVGAVERGRPSHLGPGPSGQRGGRRRGGRPASRPRVLRRPAGPGGVGQAVGRPGSRGAGRPAGRRGRRPRGHRPGQGLRGPVGGLPDRRGPSSGGGQSRRVGPVRRRRGQADRVLHRSGDEGHRRQGQRQGGGGGAGSTARVTAGRRGSGPGSH